MMRLRMLKEIGEWICCGCLYDNASQKHHLNDYTGCMRDIEEKIAHVNTTYLFNESVQALHMEEQYNLEEIEQWRTEAVKDVKERVCETYYGADEKLWDDCDNVPEVTPEIVGVLVSALKFDHMWFYGLSAFELCPTMTSTDFNNQIDSAMGRCRYRCDDYKVKRDLLKAVKDELNVRETYHYMKDSEFGPFDN